jgi:hypothetical protein
MSITSSIDTLNQTTNWETLENIGEAFQTARCSVSWFGIRKVCTWDTGESLSLSRTAAKIHTLLSKSEDSLDRGRQNRLCSIGYWLTLKITESDEYVSKCSCFFRVWVTFVDRIYLYIWNCYNWIQGRPLYLTLNAYETFFNGLSDAPKEHIHEYRVDQSELADSPIPIEDIRKSSTSYPTSKDLEYKEEELRIALQELVTRAERENNERDSLLFVKQFFSILDPLATKIEGNYSILLPSDIQDYIKEIAEGLRKKNKYFLSFAKANPNTIEKILSKHITYQKNKSNYQISSGLSLFFSRPPARSENPD